eukprot:COSAG06_NODE_17502_length_937_cov_48.830549_1_plen_139_part_10
MQTGSIKEALKTIGIHSFILCTYEYEYASSFDVFVLFCFAQFAQQPAASQQVRQARVVHYIPFIQARPSILHLTVAAFGPSIPCCHVAPKYVLSRGRVRKRFLRPLDDAEAAGSGWRAARSRTRRTPRAAAAMAAMDIA